MSVGAFCNREVVIARRDTTIVAAAKLMRHHHVGDLVVVEGEGANPKPVGIITDRDLVVELIANEVELASVTVGAVMSSQLVTARQQDSLWETMRRMQGHGIRRMVVVNDAGGLEGILTVDDLLALFGEEITALARVPGREQERERQLRE